MMESFQIRINVLTNYRKKDLVSFNMMRSISYLKSLKVNKTIFKNNEILRDVQSNVKNKTNASSSLLDNLADPLEFDSFLKNQNLSLKLDIHKTMAKLKNGGIMMRQFETQKDLLLEELEKQKTNHQSLEQELAKHSFLKEISGAGGIKVCIKQRIQLTYH